MPDAGTGRHYNQQVLNVRADNVIRETQQDIRDEMLTTCLLLYQASLRKMIFLLCVGSVKYCRHESCSSCIALQAELYMWFDRKRENEIGWCLLTGYVQKLQHLQRAVRISSPEGMFLALALLGSVSSDSCFLTSRIGPFTPKGLDAESGQFSLLHLFLPLMRASDYIFSRSVVKPALTVTDYHISQMVTLRTRHQFQAMLLQFRKRARHTASDLQ